MKAPPQTCIEPLEARIAPASLFISPLQNFTNEGNSGFHLYTFVVSLDVPNQQQAVTVDYATVDGVQAVAANNATAADGDYLPMTGTLTFPAGSNSHQVFTVVINGDTKFEQDEFFGAMITNPVGATINANAQTAFVPIRNDDVRPQISIGGASVGEGDDPNIPHQLIFPVTLSNASSETVTVTVSTTDGTAKASDADYVATVTMFTFAPGEMTKAFVVPVIADTKSEDDETVLAGLSAISATATAGTVQAVGTILADELHLSIGDGQLFEGGPGATTNMVFTVKLGGAMPGQQVTMNYATVEGTAISVGANADYQAASGTLMLTADANGNATGGIAVPVTGDAVPENNETFSVKLANVTGGVPVVKDTGVGTIRNDDPNLRISSSSLTEGDLGSPAQSMFFTVTLDWLPNAFLSFSYYTQDGTAHSDGVPYAGTKDYEPTSGNLSLLTDGLGHATVNIAVPVNGDNVLENDEFFNVFLFDAKDPFTGSPIPIQTDTAIGTILDNHTNGATLSISPASVTEGNLGTAANMTFNVTLDNAPGAVTMVVNYHTVDGTAGSGGATTAGTRDYESKSGTLFLTTGLGSRATSTTITVQVDGDGVAENNELFNVVLEDFHFVVAPDSPLPIQTDTAKGTIFDNDTNVLTINDATVVEGDSGHQDAIFIVTLTPAVQSTVTVNYATINGTANSVGALADYTAKSGTLTFAPGVTAQTIVVPILGDLVHEGDEFFKVKLIGATPGVSIANDVATGTIMDNGDPLPTISIAPTGVVEGNAGDTTHLSFVATLNVPSQGLVIVDFATLDGTATVAGNDYAAATGTILFAPGETTKTITIDVTGDGTNEGNETMSLQLSNPVGATLGTGSANGTILNDDIFASIDYFDFDLHQFDEGDGTVLVAVALSEAPVAGATVTVNFSLLSGTAQVNSDVKLHDPAVTSLTFNAGETLKTIAVDILDDSLSEADESFSVKLTSATGAIIAPFFDTGNRTIIDNDPLPTVSIGDAQITEGDNGTQDLSFTVALSAASGQTVMVNAATVDGSAHFDSDYLPLTTTVFFAPGVTSQAVKVKIVGDNIDEQMETFKVALSNPSGAVVLNGEGTGTIFDNDLRALSIADASVAEGATGDINHMIFTVSIPTAAAQDITVAYDTFDGSAKAGTNYAALFDDFVTIPQGQTSATFTVDVFGNNTAGPEKSFGIKLHDPVNATLTDSTAVGTITDDESAYKLVAVTDTSVEDDPSSATAKTMTFKVVRVGDLTLPGTVTYTTADGLIPDYAAKAGADYVAKNGTLNFAAGQTEKTIVVNLRKDIAHENTEMFDLKLTGSTGGVLKDNNNAVQLSLTGTATIIDNDLIPTISIASASVSEGNPANPGDPTTTDLTFVVSLSAADEVNDVFLTYETIDGTGETGAISTADPTHPADFTKIGPTTLTIPKGSLSASFVMHVARDTISEGDETFMVQLSNPLGSGEIFAGGDITATATGTIKNDDGVPTIAFAGANNGNLTIVEGNAGEAPATFTVHLSAASEQTVTVDVGLFDPAASGQVSLGGGGPTAATLGTDFTNAGVPTVLTFAPGETSKTLNYAIFGDLQNEADETFTVVLSHAQHAAFGGTATLQATATIKNDDPIPVLTINNVSVPEGNSGPTNLVFDVTLTGESDRDVTVDYATLDIGAVSSGAAADYLAAQGTLTFAPGEHTKTISVAVNGDTFKEGSETFSIKLSIPANAVIAQSLGIGTILDDGDTIVGLSISDAKVTEGDSGTKDASFTVQLSAASAVPVTVDIATRNGTAVVDADYTGQATTLTFAPGQVAKTFSVAIHGDTAFEATESFFVDVTNPTGGAVIVGGEGRGTIYNDDIQILNAQTVRYVDADGDLATVHITKGVLTTTGPHPVLNFSAVNNIGGRTLQMIDFTSHRAAFNLTDLAITADSQPGFSASGNTSDGRVDVGYIQGGIIEGSLLQIVDSIQFGNIVVEGDLGKIVAGNQNSPIRAVTSLSILSHGAKGTATGAPDNVSVFVGGAGRINVGGDWNGVLESIGGASGDIDSLTIKGALRGGSESGSGQVFVTGTLTSATVGAIVGGSGAASGAIIGNFTQSATTGSGSSIGTVRVLGDIVGGAGSSSGRIFAPSIGAVMAGGNLAGGSGVGSGVIQAGVPSFAGSLGSVAIKGDVIGGTGANSGEIFAAKTLGTVVVRGFLLGGTGDDSGSIVTGGSANAVTVLKNIEGGAGQRSGSVQVTKGLANFQLGAINNANDGDLIGGTGGSSGTLLIGRDLKMAGIIFGSIEGGDGTSSGGVNVGGMLTKLTIGKDLVGGSTASGAAGGVSAINASGYIVANRIGALVIGHDIVSGTQGGAGNTLAGSGTIRTFGDIGSLVVGGNIVGNADVPVVIAAGGGAAVAKNQTIGTLVVKGDTAFADILGGYGGGVSANNPLGNPVNPDAQMGMIRLVGSVEATNIVAGVDAGPDGRFGTDDDAVISGGLADNPAVRSKIAAFIVKGAVKANTDVFGVVAQIIGAATVGNTPLPLRPAKVDDLELGSPGSNFRLHELPVA